MKESATEVLLARSVDPERFGKMLGVSAIVHVVALLVLILFPSEWGVRAETEVGPTMSISLGGPEGPDTGGQTPLGGRPVQQINDLPPDPRPRAVRVPALSLIHI